MSKLELVGRNKQVFEINHAATGASARSVRLSIGEAGMSLREFSTRMGISAAYLMDLEMGRRNWNAQLVEKFNAALEGV